MRTLVELLHQRAWRSPREVLYTFVENGDEKSMTYGELAGRARRLAARLRPMAPPGSRALIVCPPGLDYIAAFFGCLEAGFIAVPAYPPNPMRLERTLPRLLAIAEDAQTAITLTTAAILELKEGMAPWIGDSALERTAWLAVDATPSPSQAIGASRYPHGEDAAFLQYTSGSTSTPKGVVLSHRNLLHNLAITARAFGCGPQSRGVFWLPPYHDMGLIGAILQPLYSGFPATLMSPWSFLERPLRWLEAIHRTEATLSGGPNFAFDLCVRKSTPEERARLDLRHWRVAFTGAEPIRPETLDRFERAFAPSGFERRSFFACYGLAEATLFVTGASRGDLPITREVDRDGLEKKAALAPVAGEPGVTLVGCGRSPDEQRIRVVDPETGRVCPADRVGEVWISGESIAKGYWNRAEETEAVFGARIEGEPGAFLRTGDLGFLSDDGELFITGRQKDVIIVRGRNLYPQDIERAIEACHPAVRGGCSAAFCLEMDSEERVVAVAEVRPGTHAEPVFGAIRRAILETYDVALHDIVLLAPGALPKTSSGKVQRRATREAYAKRTLEEVARAQAAPSVPAESAPATLPMARPVSQEAWEAWLLACAREIQPGSAANVEDPLAASLDSLGMVSLCHAVDERLGIELPLRIAMEITSVRALAARLCEAKPIEPERAALSEDETALSVGERALWFLQTTAPESTAYHVTRAAAVEGALDVGILSRAVGVLLERHAVLRSTFPAKDGLPVRLVRPPHEARAFACEPIDARAWSEAELCAALDASAVRPIDLENGPLLRISVFTQAKDRHVLLFQLHHIVCDFWSLALFFEELRAVYASLSRGLLPSLPAPSSRFATHVAREHRWLTSEGAEKSKAYWRATLGGELPRLDLPTDAENAAAAGAACTARLSADATRRIRRLAKHTGASLYAILLAGFQAILHRFTGQDDVLVGSPYARRTRGESAGVFGYFVNTIVLRADFSDAPTFANLVRRTRECVAGAIEHGELPFGLLPSLLEVPRTAESSPIFQAMFDLQRAPRLHDEGLTALAHGLSNEACSPAIAFADLRLRPLPLPRPAAQCDLTLVAAEEGDGRSDGDGIALAMEYDPRRLHAITAERMLGAFVHILEDAGRRPDARVNDLSLVSGFDAQRIRRLSRGPSQPPRMRDPVPAFELHARLRPSSAALVAEGRTIRYGELLDAVEGLARSLTRRTAGEELVGILLPRSPAFVAAILAIAKAGMAWVPLDPEWPKERLARVLATAKLDRVLATAPSAAGMADLGFVPGVDPSNELFGDLQNYERPPTEPLSGAGPEGDGSLAYVIFTSGSTGEPKGVMVPRSALRNFCSAMARAYELGPKDRVLQFAQATFDVAIEEILPTLASGSTLVLSPQNRHLMPADLLALAAREQLTVLNLPASYWHELVRALDEDGLELPASVRIVITGSEAARADSVRAWERRVPGSVRLYNAYGPTEATVTATLYAHDAVRGGLALRDRHVPIGLPLHDIEAHVLDTHLSPVPEGVVGELYLGGAGLARGYVGQPALTAASFVPHPDARTPGARLYRTGDLARRRRDGLLECLGRADSQVKVRGFRIELGEIEHALRAQAGVLAAVVLAHTELPNRPLVAYVVPSDPEAFSVDASRKALAETLPAFMLPSAFFVLPELPKLANGKLDTRALLRFDVVPAAAATAPRTEREEKLVAIWKAVLNRPAVGIHDNFFDLGGDSILAMQLASRARRVGLDFTPSVLFAHQTIAELAGACAAPAESRIENATGDVSLTPIQRAFFEHTSMPPHARQHWNQELLLSLSPSVDVTLLRNALETVLAAHDAPRLRFRDAGDGAWEQFYAPPGSPVLCWQDGDADALRACLDLTHGPLWAAGLVSGSRQLLLVAHHLVVDAVSWRILLEDVTKAYAELLRGAPIEPSPPAATFQQWANALERHAHSEACAAAQRRGREQVDGVFARIPVQGDPGPHLEADANEMRVELSADTTRAMMEVARQRKISVEVLLVTALGRALCPWAKTDALRIDLESHGRDEAISGLDLSRSLGWFTAVFPYVVMGPSEDAFADLAGVKRALREARNDATSLSLQGHPAGEMLFNYLGLVELDPASKTWFERVPHSLGSPRSPAATRTHALTLDCAIEDGRLSGTWGYSLRAHHTSAIEQLAAAWLQEVELVVTSAAQSSLIDAADFPLADLTDDQLRAIARAAPGGIEDAYTLSPVQETMLFHHLYDPHSGVTLEQTLFGLSGELDVTAFMQAWQDLFERHRSLRISAHWHGTARPVQVVHDGLTLPIEVLDWSHTPADKTQEALAELLAGDRREGFDLTQPPLMRLKLIRCAHHRWWVLWTHHHLLLDGYSLPEIFRELDALYRARKEGQAHPAPAARPYRDYIAWLRKQDLTAAERYWREALAGFRTPVRIVAGERAANAVARSETLTAQLDASLHGGLREVARRCRVTLNTLVQGAWAILLSQYSGHRDIVFGSTLSGRPAEIRGVESMVGCFMNTLPRRAFVDPEASIEDFFQKLQSVQEATRAFEHSPLGAVRTWSEVPRKSALYDLYETIVVYEDYPLEQALARGLGGLPIEMGSFDAQLDYPLVLYAFPRPELHFALLVDRRAVDRPWAEQLLQRFIALLESLTRAARIADVASLSPRDVAFLDEQNRTEVPFALEETVFAPIDRWADRTPEAIAIACDDCELTYAELRACSDELAAFLAWRGVGPEVTVGLLFDRSVHAVIAILAVLKAGGVYVPLDPESPADRLADITRDAGIRIVLTLAHLRAGLPDDGLEIHELDREHFPPEAEGRTAPLPPPAYDATAYVIFTSGSTGKPKGVQVSHRNVLHSTHARATTFPSAPRSYLMLAPFTFDPSVCGIFWTLWNGGMLVLPPPALRETAADIPTLIARHRVTHISFTPSLYAALLEIASPALLASLELVIVASETCPPALVERHARLVPQAALFNEYGPTEGTVYSTVHPCVPGTEHSVPIGKPIANVQTYVLGPGLERVPPGITGELYIAGANLARGYYGRAELTAERFVPNPYSGRPGDRMYRSGDLARYLPDGSLEFLGRQDRQVKLRGFRIELEEIETALGRHPNVSEAVVLVREDVPGDRRLVAYVIARAGEVAPAASDVRTFLRGKLPEYMVPTAVVAMDSLPLTPNGKVDRALLPAPDRANLQIGQYVPPRGDIEQTLAGAWADALGAARVSVEDNFFDLGGNSLMLLPLRQKLEMQLGRTIDLVDFFTYPTIRSLVQQLIGSETGAEQAKAEITKLREKRRLLAVRHQQMVRSKRNTRGESNHE